MFVIVSSSSRGTAPNSITVLLTSASTSHLWRTEDLLLSVFVCPFADWITQVKFPQWLPDDQPTNVATTTTKRTTITTTPHRHIFNCGNRNTFAFGELVKLPKILHILGNNKFYSNVCCRVGVPILQCWCVCARPTANDLRHRQCRGRGEEGLATQRPQIARLWQLRAMDNLNGLKGYVRLVSAWDAATTAAASSTSGVVSDVFSAVSAVLCAIFWLLAEDSGYACCIFDVNNNARLKVTAKLKWHWLLLLLQRNKGAAYKKYLAHLIVFVLVSDFTMIK